MYGIGEEGRAMGHALWTKGARFLSERQVEL